MRKEKKSNHLFLIAFLSLGLQSCSTYQKSAMDYLSPSALQKIEKDIHQKDKPEKKSVTVSQMLNSLLKNSNVKNHRSHSEKISLDIYLSKNTKEDILKKLYSYSDKRKIATIYVSKNSIDKKNNISSIESMAFANQIGKAAKIKNYFQDVKIKLNPNQKSQKLKIVIDGDKA